MFSLTNKNIMKEWKVQLRDGHVYMVITYRDGDTKMLVFDPKEAAELGKALLAEASKWGQKWA
jgi:hypothetical protein